MVRLSKPTIIASRLWNKRPEALLPLQPLFMQRMRDVELRSPDSRERLSPHEHFYGRVTTSFGDVGRTKFTLRAALAWRV